MIILWFFSRACLCFIICFGNITILRTFSLLQHSCMLLYWTPQYKTPYTCWYKKYWFAHLFKKHDIFNHYNGCIWHISGRGAMLPMYIAMHITFYSILSPLLVLLFLSSYEWILFLSFPISSKTPIVKSCYCRLHTKCKIS